MEIIYLDWICNPPTLIISKLIWDSCPASGDLQWNAAGNINVRVGGGPSSRGLTPLRECFNEVFWWKHLYFIDNWILWCTYSFISFDYERKGLWHRIWINTNGTKRPSQVIKPQQTAKLVFVILSVVNNDNRLSFKFMLTLTGTIIISYFITLQKYITHWNVYGDT